MSRRYVLIGLADHRAEWMRRVSRWATDEAIPVEFVRTRSAGELRALLDTGRPYSSVLLDATTSAVGRGLLDALRHADCAAVVVAAEGAARDWVGLGAAAVLDPGFDRESLARVLASHCRPVPIRNADAAALTTDEPGPRCPTVLVTGPPGVGRSTLAMAVAQGLSREPHRRPLALADFCLEADLAVLLGAGDAIPGVQELVECHRLGRPATSTVRRLLVPLADYDLLTGLGDRDDWTLLRRGSVSAGLTSLQRAYRTLVIDGDADVSGEHDTGSTDLEDRNSLSRAAVDGADVVMVVGRATRHGVHRLLRTTARLSRVVRPHATLVPVLNQATRRDPTRHDALAALATLATRTRRPLAAPVTIAPHRNLDRRLEHGGPLPRSLVQPVSAAVSRHLDLTPTPAPDEPGGQRIQPGELGHWTDDEEAA
ncbi:MAG: hypothetical protein OES57_05920 [Acidimicrobiia bacterium]|nr:hypothetical protein [Acidimicrobiia bacterium]